MRTRCGLDHGAQECLDAHPGGEGELQISWRNEVSLNARRLKHARIGPPTVAVNAFIFKQPVRVGDILSFFSKLTRIGRTSITVKVEVYAERFRSQGSYIKVTEASLTYVAIDEAGQPREVPKPADS